MAVTNQLTGTIPTELAGMGNLTKVYFSENVLTGSLDQWFCAENRSTCDLLQVVRCRRIGTTANKTARHNERDENMAAGRIMKL